MTYVHIPVVWTEPKVSDFELFAALLNNNNRRTPAHCVVNLRVSAFTFLYRVIHQGVNASEAKAIMEVIWNPNPNWEAFIDDILSSHDIDYYAL